MFGVTAKITYYLYYQLMETKTLLSMLLCYHVATKNQQISRFDKNFQNVNGQNIV